MKKSMKGLAHIGIHTDKIDESIEFYTEILGFELTHRKDMPNGTRLAFVDVGGLVVELVQPADTSGVKERKAGIIDHIAIEVDDIDKVIQNLKEKGVEFNTPEKNVNKHLFDGISNIFFKGPNGESLELFQYE